MSEILKNLSLKHGVFVTLLLTLLISGCREDQTSGDTADSNAEPKPAAAEQYKTVFFETSMGDFTVQLNAGRAPITVDNFIQYIESGHYDGTIFHRVIGNFMIQGGGFTSDMTQKSTRAPITNEADNGLTNSVGTIAMARTSMPHSATSQFFINVENNSSLNHRAKNNAGWGYAVFGQVTRGMDVIEAIKQVATGRRGQHGNVPLEPVVIKRIYQAKTEQDEASAND